MRSLKTPFSRDLFSKEYDATVSNEELEALGVGALQLAAVDGDIKGGCFLAGQIAGLVNKEQSVEEIIDELVREYEQLMMTGVGSLDCFVRSQ